MCVYIRKLQYLFLCVHARHYTISVENEHDFKCRKFVLNFSDDRFLQGIDSLIK